MPDRPILFSGPLIRAILAGRKTVTRRVVKEPKVATLYGRHSLPDRHHFDRGFGDGVYLHWFYGGGDYGDDAVATRVWAPWQKGDRLWVKEAWRLGSWSIADRIVAEVVYAADDARRAFTVSDEAWFTREKSRALKAKNSAALRPSLYMPRWASRLTLEVTNVRAERLQSITEEDARAEGIEACDGALDEAEIYRRAKLMGETPAEARVWFAVLWDSINGKRPGCSWDANPWVWRIAFRRVDANAETSSV